MIEVASPPVAAPGLGDVTAEREAVSGLVQSLDPESVPLPDAPAVREAFQRMERLAANAKTVMSRRVDASREWQRKGYKTPAEFLAAKEGVTPAEARRELDTSKKLLDLPRTEEAAKNGDLSAGQLGLVAEASAANPQAEGSLLEQAGAGTFRELRDAAGRARAAGDRDRAATERRIHRRRSVTTWTDPDGTWHLSARGTVSDGARIEAALKPLTDRRFRDAAKRGERDGRDAYAFDALLEATEAATSSSARKVDSSDDPTAPAPAPAPAQVHVRVDVEALARGSVEGDEYCEIMGVGPISVERARELLGDAIVDIVITKGVEVATIAPGGRGWTAYQRLALLWNRSKCSVHDCPCPRVEIDHHEPFAEGGPTTVANARPLCRWHHHLKTHQGYRLIGPPERRELVAPDDPRNPNRRC